MQVWTFHPGCFVKVADSPGDDVPLAPARGEGSSDMLQRLTGEGGAQLELCFSVTLVGNASLKISLLLLLYQGDANLFCQWLSIVLKLNER